MPPINWSCQACSDGQQFQWRRVWKVSNCPPGSVFRKFCLHTIQPHSGMNETSKGFGRRTATSLLSVLQLMVNVSVQDSRDREWSVMLSAAWCCGGALPSSIWSSMNQERNKILSMSASTCCPLETCDQERHKMLSASASKCWVGLCQMKSTE